MWKCANNCANWDCRLWNAWVYEGILCTGCPENAIIIGQSKKSPNKKDLYLGGEQMHQYDYLVVGAGLYGAVMARELNKRGKKCLVIDRRDHIAGNIYCEDIEGIHVHKYGAHIFHTSN